MSVFSNLLNFKEMNLRWSADAGAEAAGADTAEAVEGVVEDAPEEAGEAPVITVAEEEYQKLVADVERFRDLALRSQADLDNYRKRMIREIDENRRRANNDLLERLLPVVDNFELGLMAARQSGDQNIVMGMSMVQRQLADFLDQSGLKPVEVDGVPFDPKVHEAVSQEASDTVPAGHVIRASRKGYRLGENLLRAATVVVSTGPAA
jgi:molecular chaperone GrpE